MDTLRTQKIRFLVSVYRDMKTERQPDDRYAWLDKMYDILADEEPTKTRNEVRHYTKFRL